MIIKDLKATQGNQLHFTRTLIGKVQSKVKPSTPTEAETNMGNKNGWGQAKLGKTLSSQENVDKKYGSYKKSNVKSSKDLDGLYEDYQGNRQGTKGK